MHRLGICALLGFAVAAGGCATRADFELVRRQQREMRASLADIQANLETTRRQVSARGEDDTSARALAAIDSLDQRVGALEEAFKGLAHTRVGMPVEGGGGESGVTGLPGGVPRTQAARLAWKREVLLQQSGGSDPNYVRGLQLYREGQSEAAIRTLRDFVNANPKSELADNAQFWLGEAYYSRGDYNRSIIELNEVLLKHPQGDQIPGALLALATAFANSGDTIDARLILQKLIGDHPQSEEATIGREQLTALTN